MSQALQLHSIVGYKFAVAKAKVFPHLEARVQRTKMFHKICHGLVIPLNKRYVVTLNLLTTWYMMKTCVKSNTYNGENLPRATLAAIAATTAAFSQRRFPLRLPVGLSLV
jgi:hypothetical protein